MFGCAATTFSKISGSMATLGGRGKLSSLWKRLGITCGMSSENTITRRIFWRTFVSSEESSRGEKGGINERWKVAEVCGYGSNKKDGTRGCGIVIKVVERGNWITISKAAVPLDTCSAMAAEFMGGCMLTNVLNLPFAKELRF